jgi:hypothetical protein
MTAFHRWCIVAFGVVLLIGVPLAVRQLPAHDEDLSATDLLTRIEASRNHPYTGYVETQGNLQLPITDQFTDVGALFGEQTRMRVWWRSAKQWRVDKLLVAGETDLIHDSAGTIQWSYEAAKATVSRDPDIRLPRTADLTPPELGARLLDDVDPDELSRLSARRVAGRDALGLRVVPASPQSSIDHADLWVDPSTGVPLAVAVHGRADGQSAFTSEFREFSGATPDAAETRFTAPPGAEVGFDDVLDIADAANQYARVLPPVTLAGLEKSQASDRAVGVYGAGVTQIVVIPLRDREAHPLREQLGSWPGSRLVPEGVVLSVGPLGVLLTGSHDEAGWLLAGTVTEDTLATAAGELVRNAVYVGDLP